jgi:WD40 repeat protein
MSCVLDRESGRRFLMGMAMIRHAHVALVLCAMAALGGAGIAVPDVRAAVARGQERSPRAGDRKEGGDSLPDGALRRLGELRFNHGTELNRVDFALGGKALLSAGRDGVIRVWDVKSGAERYAIAKGQLHFYSSALSHDGASLMTRDDDGVFRLWDLESGRELRQWQPPEANGRVDLMAFSHDAKTVATVGLNDKACSLWNVTRNEPTRRLVGIELSICDIAFSPDGKTIATAAASGIARGGVFAGALPAPDQDSERVSIRLWDVDNGVRPVHDLAISSDGKLLLSGSLDGSVRLRDLASDTARELLEDVRRQGRRASGLAFASDARFMTASGRILDVITGRQIAMLHIDSDGGDFAPWSSSSVLFTPDAKSIISWMERDVCVWESSTGKILRRIAGSRLKALWSDLAADDAPRANRASWTMAALAERAVPFLAEHLRPIGADDADKDTSLGLIASGETLRRLRAIAVLERAGTADANRILERLASGLPGARETRDAKASLRRME